MEHRKEMFGSTEDTERTFNTDQIRVLREVVERIWEKRGVGVSGFWMERLIFSDSRIPPEPKERETKRSSDPLAML